MIWDIVQKIIENKINLFGHRPTGCGMPDNRLLKQSVWNKGEVKTEEADQEEDGQMIWKNGATMVYVHTVSRPETGQSGDRWSNKPQGPLSPNSLPRNVRQ